MKTKLNVLFVAAILLFTSYVKAESKVSLRLNLQKGTTYEMTMAMNNNIDQDVMGQKMKIDQKMEMVSLYQVLDVLPTGNFLIEYSMQKIKVNMTVNGQEINMDSDGDASNPMNGPLKTIVSNKLKLELNKRGTVERVEGLEEYTKKLSENPQLAQSMQMFTNENSFKSYVGQTFSYFPENEVAKGEKWTSSLKLPSLMNMETTMNFEVADIKADQVTLNVTSDVNLDSPIEQMGMKMQMKAKGTQTGTMAIDIADGWLRSSSLNQKFDIHMNMKNPQSGEDMEIPMVMNSVATTQVVKK